MAASVRRNRNVYILGAGFSADAGAPLMATFLQTARELHESPKNTLEPIVRDHYARVFEYRQEAKRSRDSLRIDLENIEELFGLVDVSAIAGDPQDANSLPAESIKHLIADTVSRYEPHGHRLRIIVREEDVSVLPHPELLRPFFKESGGNWAELEMYEYQFTAALFAGLFEPREEEVEDAVVTLNYDTILEQALWAIGAQAEYRLSLTKNVGMQISAERGVALPIAKLHGSSNWAYVQKKNVRAYVYDSYRASVKRCVKIPQATSLRTSSLTSFPSANTAPA